jgi:hypothetical protein
MDWAVFEEEVANFFKSKERARYGNQYVETCPLKLSLQLHPSQDLPTWDCYTQKPMILS